MSIPQDATAPGLSGGLVSTHSSILRSLDSFQDQVVLLLQEAGMYSGAYSQQHPLREALRDPTSAPPQWNGLDTILLRKMLKECFEAEKDIANVMAKGQPRR